MMLILFLSICTQQQKDHNYCRKSFSIKL
uniref:Uncharacterized protein n=1 Tax=Rhizophora mucronata TaxID=61149 RepID=A0A2P2NXN5_RHIMU